MMRRLVLSPSVLAKPTIVWGQVCLQLPRIWQTLVPRQVLVITVYKPRLMSRQADML